MGKGAMPGWKRVNLAVRSKKGILPLACGVCWLFRARASGSSVRWEKLVLWDSQKVVEHTLCPAAA